MGAFDHSRHRMMVGNRNLGSGWPVAESGTKELADRALEEAHHTLVEVGVADSLQPRLLGDQDRMDSAAEVAEAAESAE